VRYSVVFVIVKIILQVPENELFTAPVALYLFWENTNLHFKLTLPTELKLAKLI